MMPIEKDHRPLASEWLQTANHLFFIVALLFVAQQNALTAEAARSQAPFIAQALNLQPRTPPPAYDPDQLSVDELDAVSTREAQR